MYLYICISKLRQRAAETARRSRNIALLVHKLLLHVAGSQPCSQRGGGNWWQLCIIFGSLKSKRKAKACSYIHKMHAYVCVRGVYVCVCWLHYVLEYFMAAARHKVGANAVRSITRGCSRWVCVCVCICVCACTRVCVCVRIVDWYANCIWLLTCARRAFSTHRAKNARVVPSSLYPAIVVVVTIGVTCDYGRACRLTTLTCRLVAFVCLHLQQEPAIRWLNFMYGAGGVVGGVSEGLKGSKGLLV